MGESERREQVVVGASAGGVESVSRLLGSLDAKFPLPIVVAQHLDPKHPSHLVEVLARRSALPVRPLEPGGRSIPASRTSCLPATTRRSWASRATG